MASRVSEAVASAMMSAFAAAVDAGATPGEIEVRVGAQPASPQVAATGTLLATFVLDPDPFDPPAAETNYMTLTANAIASVTAVAGGNAGWFRLYDGDGTAIYDGAVTVTGGGGEMTIGNVAISNGSEVNVTSFAIKFPKGY